MNRKGSKWELHYRQDFSRFLFYLKSRDLKKQILNESWKKFERKRRILESQRLKEKQKEEKIELGKAYKSVTERSLYSLLFSNKLDYEVNLIVSRLNCVRVFFWLFFLFRKNLFLIKSTLLPERIFCEKVEIMRNLLEN